LSRRPRRTKSDLFVTLLAEWLVWLLAAAELWYAHHLYSDGSVFWAAVWATASIQTCVRNVQS